jgi:predicted ATPase
MLPGSEIIDQVAKLVAKSLVAADVGDAKPGLRLLETARAYALTLLDDVSRCGRPQPALSGKRPTGSEGFGVG